MPNEILEIVAGADEPRQTTTDALPVLACDGPAEADDIASFAACLLGALATMAVRSKRRQADLSAAMHRSGLQASGEMVAAALHHLKQQGCIEDLVPLYDGGMLMSVTARGVEHLNTSPRWTTLDHASPRSA